VESSTEKEQLKVVKMMFNKMIDFWFSFTGRRLYDRAARDDEFHPQNHVTEGFCYLHLTPRVVNLI